MILTLLAALFGAAQEGIVYEGAEITYSVDNHPGSTYSWEVYTQFNPDILAQPADFSFTTSSNSNSVGVLWSKHGLYYLKVTETDVEGCSNVKAIAVNVLTSERYIGFISIRSENYYSSSNNGFEIPLEIVDSDGYPLASTYFPLNVEFSIDGIGHNQSVIYTDQNIHVNNDWINASSGQTRSFTIEIISAKDQLGGIITKHPQKSTHIRTVRAIPVLEFITNAGKITQGESFEHKVRLNSGNRSNARYNWIVSPETGTSTNLSATDGSAATIVWDGDAGIYTLSARAIDGNGYITSRIYQQIEIVKPPEEELTELQVDVGRDTIISSCNNYVLEANITDTIQVSYYWEPADNLDDPYKANPVFNPVQTTTFKLTVADSLGRSAVDSFTVSVTDIVAEAGGNIFIRQGETVILEGGASSGNDISYHWTTNTGIIESGQNTSSPVVSGPGTYYLEIADNFGCVATDSVKVQLLSFAPIASDDYDTTSHITEIQIAVLDNDVDPDNDIDPLSLTITELPFNGTAYVNYNNFTIHYTPNYQFSGNDFFGYQICDTAKNCDKAGVYVMVTDHQFLIPDAFSPNGDNINDYFEIIGIDRFEGNSIKIFNRWGNKVYEAINYGIETTPQFWDGKSNSGILTSNEELPTGTYYYVLDLGNGENPIAGSIYLDR